MLALWAWTFVTFLFNLYVETKPFFWEHVNFEQKCLHVNLTTRIVVAFSTCCMKLWSTNSSNCLLYEITGCVFRLSCVARCSYTKLGMEVRKLYFLCWKTVVKRIIRLKGQMMLPDRAWQGKVFSSEMVIVELFSLNSMQPGAHFYKLAQPFAKLRRLSYEGLLKQHKQCNVTIFWCECVAVCSSSWEEEPE